MITSIILFGLVVLPMHQSNLDKLDVVRQKMLREIVGWVRYSEDSWETIMRRMKHRVTKALEQHPVKAWSERLSSMREKYLDRLENLPNARWEVQSTQWVPTEVADVSQEFYAHRLRGRPVLRWNDVSD